jgi:hypothetical protein
MNITKQRLIEIIKEEVMAEGHDDARMISPDEMEEARKLNAKLEAIDSMLAVFDPKRASDALKIMASNTIDKLKSIGQSLGSGRTVTLDDEELREGSEAVEPDWYPSEQIRQQEWWQALGVQEQAMIVKLLRMMGKSSRDLEEMLADPRELATFLSDYYLADKVEIAEGFRRLIQRVICESDGVAGNFGGVAGELGAQRTAGVDSPDHDLYGPQQTAEDNFVGILNDIGHMLDVWEQKNYMSDEARYQSYFEDLQNLLEEYDPCAHRGEKCEDSHPGQSHEECVEVTINNALYEVSSEKQRRYMCAMKDASANKRPKGLSKAEAEEMCKSKVEDK